MGKADNISVVVSTYNAPGRLVLVLHALARQTILPAEVLIADDGSTADTARILEDVGHEVPFPIVHVWQPDKGFRLARGRNNAIYHSKGDILAMLDQDTLPHHDWLYEHVKAISHGHVSIGFVIRMKKNAEQGLSAATIRDGSFERMHDPSEKDRLDKHQVKYQFYALLRNLGLGVKNRPSMAFGNAAISRNDIFKVNGFDEEYVGWGQEDDDLGRRLYMAGIRPVPVVNRALVSHIPHELRRDEDWRNGPNVARYQRKLTGFRCERGLSAHPHADVKVAMCGRDL